MDLSSETSSLYLQQQTNYPGPAVIISQYVSTKLYHDDNSNNYESWKELMLCFIESQGLLGFIDKSSIPPGELDYGYVNWRRSDRLVKGLILGALSDDMLRDASKFDTAKDVWLELEKTFQSDEAESEEVHKYLPLYRAAVKGDWRAANEIIKQDPNIVEARLSFCLRTVLHIAVGTSKSMDFVTNLVRSMPDNKSLEIQDNLGLTALHIAAITGNTAAARILVGRNTNLLYIPNNAGIFPVCSSALNDQKDTLRYLISVTKDDLEIKPLSGQCGAELLLAVIELELLDLAIYLVDKYPDMVKIAASSNNAYLQRIAYKDTLFLSGARFNIWQRFLYSCVELNTSSNVRHAPTTVDNDVEDPICWDLISHVPGLKSIRVKKLMHQQAIELVKCLCNHIKSLPSNEADYHDVVFQAACFDIREIVEIIVDILPDAIYAADRNTNGTIFHVAVLNRCDRVFNLVYQMSDHKYLLLNMSDIEGNTILHLAAKLAPPHKLNQVSGPALQMQREIQWFKEVERSIPPSVREQTNNEYKTAKMIFTEEHDKLKVDGEKWMKDTANSCSITAALIATIVFAAAITVPGGNESNSGFPMFSSRISFIIFAISDAISLFTSTTSLLMFLSILTSRYAEEDFLYALPKRLCIGLFTLFISILFMITAFSAIVYLVFGRQTGWLIIPVVALACLPISSFVLLQFPLLVDVISSTYGRGIFGKQNDKPFF